MESTRIAFDLKGIGSELNERLIAVPIYQRSYAWSRDEVEEYWEDVRAAFASGGPEYFMGTIVLTRQAAPPRDSVIDGQQRLATTSILLAAIRDEYAVRGDGARADIVQDTYLSTSDLASAEKVARLTLNSEDAFLYDCRIVGSADEPEPTRQSHALLLSAYTFFRERIQQFTTDAGAEWATRLAAFVEFLKSRLIAIVLEVPTEADAFLIFETLNDRGADLTIADLLKNYLFGRAGAKLDAVRDGWMQILGTLEISAENSLFTTFLRQYWSSHHGAVRERDLYRSIKENVATQTQVVAFINELQRGATLYSALLNADHEYWDGLGGTIRENVETLLRLDLEQNRPLLLAALQHFTDREKRRLLRAIVAWSVRGLIVGGIGGGTAEKSYCRAAVKIRDGSIKSTREVLEEIASVVAPDDDFKAAFAMARVTRAPIARYYLSALERVEQGEAEPELVPNSNEDQVNLEHVLPKRATEADWGKDFDRDERRSLLYRLGNQVLLQKGPNGRIGNKPFSKKKPILSKSKFVLTQEAGAETRWNPGAVDKRQARLAELAILAWPRA